MAKQYLNIQEQVQKNKDDILKILQGAIVLGEFNIKVIGQVDDAEELPDPDTYDGDYGDAYCVGTEAPYHYWVFTRPFDEEDTPHWFDVGLFPAPGPQGEPGADGQTGPAGRGITSITKIDTQGLNDTYKIEFTDGSFTTYIVKNGADGESAAIVGATAYIDNNQGTPSVTLTLGGSPLARTFNFDFKNLKGPTGAKGDPGAFFNIAGQVANPNLLPAAADVPATKAYLVGSTPPYDVYAIMDVNEVHQWINLGPVAVIESDTKVGSNTFTPSGTLNSLILDEIVNNASVDFIKIGGRYFTKAEESVGEYTYFSFDYSNNDEIALYKLLLNTSTGEWSITEEVAIKSSSVVKHQANAAIIQTPLKNINGRDLTAFTSSSVTIGGYPAVVILENNHSLTKARAADYMKAMTGSDFVPEYDLTNPTYTYFISSDLVIYKVQYDNANGLVLYIAGTLMDLLSNQTVSGNKNFTGSLKKNNVDVATIDQAFNVINASDIAAGGLLTQDQYDLITNGKPTLIKGTFLTYENMFLPTFNVSGNSIVRVYFSCNNELIAVALNPVLKSLSLVSGTSQIAGLKSVYSINGKPIPAYPSSPTSSRLLGYKPNNTLAYLDKLFENSSGYGLVPPDTSGYTVDKTIATVEQIPSVTKKYLHALSITGSSAQASEQKISFNVVTSSIETMNTLEKVLEGINGLSDVPASGYVVRSGTTYIVYAINRSSSTAMLVKTNTSDIIYLTSASINDKVTALS